LVVAAVLPPRERKAFEQLVVSANEWIGATQAQDPSGDVLDWTVTLTPDIRSAMMAIRESVALEEADAQPGTIHGWTVGTPGNECQEHTLVDLNDWNRSGRHARAFVIAHELVHALVNCIRARPTAKARHPEAQDVIDEYRASRAAVEFVRASLGRFGRPSFAHYLAKRTDDWPEMVRDGSATPLSAAMRLAFVAPIYRALGMNTTKYKPWQTLVDAMDAWYTKTFLADLAKADAAAAKQLMGWMRDLPEGG